MPQTKLLKFTIFFTVCCLSLFASTLSTFIMQAVTYYHVSATSAGTLEAYQNFSMIFFLIGLFSLILKLGYRNSLIIVIAVMLIIAILMPIIDKYIMLKIYLIGLGLVFVAMKVVLYSTVPLTVKNDAQLAMMLALLEFFWAFSSVIGMWIIAYVLHYYPHLWLSFTWVFALVGGITILLWQFTPLDESSIAHQQQNFTTQLKSMWQICNNRYLVAMLAVAFFANLIEMGFGAWLPGFYQQALSMSASLSIKIASFALITTMAGRVVVVLLLKFVCWVWALFIYYASGLITLIYVFSHLHLTISPLKQMSDTPIAAIILTSLGFFLAPGTPLLNASILSKTNKDKHVLLMTVLTIIFAIASSIGVRIIGQLIDHLGMINGFKIATITPLAILVVIIIPYAKFIKKGSIN
ncbi:MAG: MFS transporter [Burkholderiales bacterium]|nr:MFS transporter [Burkholderiales bacterium]